MRDFLDGLDGQLRTLAAAPPKPALQAASVRMLAPLARTGLPQIPRPAMGAVLAGLGTVAASTVLMTSSSVAGLPILETETSDASAVAGAAKLPRSIDFRRAHAFETPSGPGYVLRSRNGRDLCITAPDSATPGLYGATCAPLATAVRSGIALELVGDLAQDPKATDLVALVLPEGAAGAKLETGRTTGPAVVRDGVVVADLTTPGVISYRLRGRTVRTPFEGPLRSRGVTCPDGSVAPLPAPLPAGSTPPARPKPSCR